MQIFTKILFSDIHRIKGHIFVIIADDSYFHGDTKQESMGNKNATINLLSRLGFSIHTGK